MDDRVITSVGQTINQMGYSTLRFNFRGVMPSTETYKEPAGSLDDAIQVARYLYENLAVRSVGVVGYSYGGSIALALATRIKLDFIITLSASLDLLVDTGTPVESLGMVRPPVLLVHGLSDTVVPFSDMDALSNLIGDHVETYQIENENHFFVSSLLSVADHIENFIRSVWDG